MYYKYEIQHLTYILTPLNALVVWQSSSPCMLSHRNEIATGTIQVPGQTKTQVSK